MKLIKCLALGACLSVAPSLSAQTASQGATVTFRKGLTIGLSGHLPTVGSMAPDFTATKADLSEVRLSDLRGKRVVLNIFPSVDTGVCAASVRRFNAELSGLDNTVVLCLSKDLPFALGRFCAAEGLSAVVPLSAFRDTSLEAGYGVLMTDGPLRGLLARAVVVIDTDGKVLYTELVPEIAQDPNFEGALKALKP